MITADGLPEDDMGRFSAAAVIIVVDRREIIVDQEWV